MQKNLKILSFGAVLTLGLTVFGTKMLYSKNSVSVKAEESNYVFDGEKDMSKDVRGSNYNVWSSENDEFVEVENWFYSNKGFSFEFKFNSTNLDDRKPMTYSLFSGDDNLTISPNKTYLFDLNEQKEPIADPYKTVGGITPLTGEDIGWYKYDIMFAELGNFITDDGSCYKTVDKMIFNWVADGYYSDLTIRKMQIVDEFKEVNIQSYTADKFLTFKESRAVPTYKGFFEKQKGIFMDFKTTNNVYMSLVNDGGISSSNRFYALNLGDPANSKGKIFPLGNDWYRYEVMLLDVGKLDGISNADLGGVNFPWGASEYSFSSVKAFGIIDGYSYNVTYHFDGQEVEMIQNGYLPEPSFGNKDGYHIEGWYLDDQLTQKFDFSQVITSDIDLYAKYENHTISDYQYDDNEHWRSCECGYYEVKEAHNFVESVQDKYLVSEANCQSPAVYHKSCVCGKVSEETFTYGEVNLDNHVHTDSRDVNFVCETCEEDGGYDTEVFCVDCGEVISSTHRVIDKIGHNYKLQDWELSENKESAFAYFVCGNDPEHIVKVDATISDVQIIGATYEEDGAIIYSLTVTFEGKTYNKTIEEVIPMLVKPEEKNTNGCGGIISASSIIGITSLVGLALITFKKKEK